MACLQQVEPCAVHTIYLLQQLTSNTGPNGCSSCWHRKCCSNTPANGKHIRGIEIGNCTWLCNLSPKPVQDELGTLTRSDPPWIFKLKEVTILQQWSSSFRLLICVICAFLVGNLWKVIPDQPVILSDAKVLLPVHPCSMWLICLRTLRVLMLPFLIFWRPSQLRSQ